MSSEESIDRSGRAARIARFYLSSLMSIAALAMGLIVIIMFVQVFYRYALNSSLIWAEEICRYLLMLMTFLLIGPAFERGEMASVQFFIQSLPARTAKLVIAPIYLAMIAFLFVVSYFGYRFATFNSHFSMPSIDFILTALLGQPVSGALSMYWIYLLIPFGCLLLAGHLAFALARRMRAP
jgi:TRAP-type C4-dicarboxylate transport system permease small subunit